MPKVVNAWPFKRGLRGLLDYCVLAPEKPPATFERCSRLLEAKDFKRVFDDNRFRSSCRTLLILAIENQPQKKSRLGIVVAKKNVRRAIDRNRIKRLVREYFRQQVLSPLCPMDFVVLARSGIAGLNNGEVRVALASLFNSVLKKAASEKKTDDVH